MDGLNLKFSSDAVEKYFIIDEMGALIPSEGNLQMEKAKRDIEKQNKADSNYYHRVSDINYNTDVKFTNNPYGNTPTIGAGLRLFGPRPLKGVKFNGSLNITPDSEVQKKLDKRERKIVENQKHLMDLHASLEPAKDDLGKYLVWMVEGDQVMTGGGFDGNQIGGVTESGLNFVNRGRKHNDYNEDPYSQLVVQGSKWLRDYLESEGLVPGSLKPMGASAVRLAQETDGMIGWPVYSKALSPLTPDIALRLLIETGIDTRQLVNSAVVDARDGATVKYRVVDALAYILDRSVLDAADVPSYVTLLARIQKHGWKMENGEIVPKKAKTRSIYPNSALASIIEAMTIAPFNDKLKELKVSFMPSLQDKATRVDMVWDMIQNALSKDYDYLPADWSKYDATVNGKYLATMIYYAVRPFYNAQYYAWIDYVIYSLVYKYLMMDTSLCEIHNDMLSEAKQRNYVESNGISIFGLTDGLISGAKFTHVGGSMYGEVVVHYCIPRLIGYAPMIGAQAGDDTLLAYPIAKISPNSVEDTYAPIVDAATKLGLDINASKQVWKVVEGEPAKIFLQDVYHYKAQVKGIGSIFRPYDAVFFSERDKGLSVAEQLMAEIARMNQGADNPFAPEVVNDWLDHEKVIGVLFKEYGVSGFDRIVEAIGLSPEMIAQRIDVGSFTFGVSRGDLEKGTMPILPVISDVAGKMDYGLSPSQAFRIIGVKSEEGSDDDDLLDSADPNAE